MRNVFNKGVFYRFFVLLGENIKIFSEIHLKKVADTPSKIHIGEKCFLIKPKLLLFLWLLSER